MSRQLSEWANVGGAECLTFIVYGRDAKNRHTAHKITVVKTNTSSVRSTKTLIFSVVSFTCMQKAQRNATEVYKHMTHSSRNITNCMYGKKVY